MPQFEIVEICSTTKGTQQEITGVILQNGAYVPADEVTPEMWKSIGFSFDSGVPTE